MSRPDALRALLEAHHPDDDRERRFRDRMLALCATERPMARDRFDPGHFTASAFVLSPDREAVLLVLHGKLHRWLQPGGHIDPGDADVFAAARREVHEEVGLADVALADGPGLFDLDIHDIPQLGSSPPHQHFDVRVLFVAPHRDAHAGSDARDVRWVPLHEVSRDASDDSVMRAVRKLRRR